MKKKTEDFGFSSKKSNQMVKKMENTQKILYVQTSDDPERQYSPLVLAQSAKAMDIDAEVYYLGQALRILNPSMAKKIQAGSFPSVYEMIQKTLSLNIPIYVCQASTQLLNIDKADLISGLKIVGAATLNDLALNADSTMWF